MLLNLLYKLLNYKKYQSIFILLLIPIYIIFKGSFIPHFCLLESILNLKCSFCGLTAALDELFIGNLNKAIKINFVSIILLLYFFIYIFLKKIKHLHGILLLDKILLFFCFFRFIICNL